jgi:hypothetical protein
MTSTKALFWAAFAVFVLLVLWFDWHEAALATDVPLAPLKLLVWAAFVAFLGYTIYCSTREDLVTSVLGIAKLHWGRQIGIDLYLGLALSLTIVYLNEGSALVTLLWLLPTLAFANLATLLYFALHFDEIVAKLLG